MNIQRKNSTNHFRMQSERKQTLNTWILTTETVLVLAACSCGSDVGM